MTDDLIPFPDAEVVCKALLDGVILVDGTPARVVTETPAKFTPPLIEVQRLPGLGANDGLTDFPHLQVACFASTRADAWAMARHVEAVILASGRALVLMPDGTSQLIDKTESVNSPDQRAYEDQEKRRVVATYRFAMRRPVIRAA